MSDLKAAYTPEQVLELAPDSSSAKSGRELAVEKKWQNLGASDRALWGECQGSGAKPYQTRVDLSGPAFKCNCPSRKFPCKHGLALFLLALQKAELFAITEAPGWVSEWLASRAEKSEKKKEREEAPRSEEELEKLQQAKEKRKQDRLDKVEAGLDELNLFLQDLMRQGTANLKSKPNSFWQERAARLVDAQAPGLARRLNEAAGYTTTRVAAPNSDPWQENLLLNLGQLHLIVQAYKNKAQLNQALQEDIASAMGFTHSQEELLKEAGLKDTFLVLGQYVTQEDRLRVQRTYLLGKESGRLALILAFAHGVQPFERLLVPGKSFAGEIVYFPSNTPLRALIKVQGEALSEIFQPAEGATAGSTREKWSQWLSLCPFHQNMPVIFTESLLFQHEGRWWLRDQEGTHTEVTGNQADLWMVLSFSTGKALTVFGLFDGHTLWPLAALTKEGQYLKLSRSENKTDKEANLNRGAQV
ncbi:MAG: SWIM zinc finger family protein [Candidatus Obscuribacter sp.]|nr:SWIM zinc finger family protein [Candidatus Obscuribacter sp.]